MPSGLFSLSFWTGSFPILGVSSLCLVSSLNIEIPVSIAKSGDPDQMQHSATSDLGLHCLPMSIYWDARHK